MNVAQKFSIVASAKLSEVQETELVEAEVDAIISQCRIIAYRKEFQGQFGVYEVYSKQIIKGLEEEGFHVKKLNMSVGPTISGAVSVSGIVMIVVSWDKPTPQG